MEVRAHRYPTSKDWKELYMAAIFEDDKAKIPQRIVEAERALVTRAVELFDASGDQVREQQAMENAAYFLRLLRKIDGGLTTPHLNTPASPYTRPAISMNGPEGTFLFPRKETLHMTGPAVATGNE